MKRPALVAVLAIACLALAILLVPARAVADAVTSVLITNWPKVWSVVGAVSIEGPVKTSKGVALREIVVPSVNPKDTVRLIQGPAIETDGFGYMVLSLQGQVKGEVSRPGSVGAFLLPDEEPIVKAFDERGIMQFFQEVSAAGVNGSEPYFASNQPRVQVGFSRYRTYFYNSSDKSVTVNLFVYLSN
jgi:hypothetical protein